MADLPQPTAPSPQDLANLLRTEGSNLYFAVRNRLAELEKAPDPRLQEASLYWRGALGGVMTLIDSPTSPEASVLVVRIMEAFTAGVDLWVAHARDTGDDSEALELLTGLSSSFRNLFRGDTEAVNKLKLLIARAEDLAQA